MLKILWNLINKFDNNLGYSTPLQKRYSKGDFARISNYKLSETKISTNEVVMIVETKRHDYLIKDGNNTLHIVYQFELENC